MTPYEIRVLKLRAEGKTIDEIARLLELTRSQVAYIIHKNAKE